MRRLSRKKRGIDGKFKCLCRCINLDGVWYFIYKDYEGRVRVKHSERLFFLTKWQCTTKTEVLRIEGAIVGIPYA